MRIVLAGTFLLATLPAASAQEFSARGDRAMWCQLALEYPSALSVFTEDEHFAASAAADRHGEVVYEEIKASGMSKIRLGELALAYHDEVLLQVNDYAVNKDVAALRFSLEDCVASGV